MNRTQIMEHLGADTIEDVQNEFGGMWYSQVLMELDLMFREDANEELAQAIVSELKCDLG